MPYEYKNTVVHQQSDQVLIVCIGNDLIADDAAGHEVFLRLQHSALPGTVRLEYAAVGGVALLDRLTGEERVMIVVDAVQFGAPAGTIHCIPWDELPVLAAGALSGHDIGLKETIEIGKLLYPEKLPRQIVLVGIEGRCFNRTRDYMTPETAAGIEDAVLLIQKIAQAPQGALT